MKIIYILEQFYLHGGIEKIVSIKANWLAKKGYDVTIIVNNQRGKEKIYPLNGNIKFIDLRINYDISKSYFNPINIIKAPKHIWRLRRVLKRIKPDFIIILSLQFDYFLLPFITKSKTIREFHSSKYFYNLKRKKKIFPNNLKFLINDFIEKKYTCNVVLNKDEKQYYKNRNTIIIPNGIQKLKINYNINKKLKIISAGRMAPVKNFEELIDIWEEIYNDFPQWRLEIYGGGDKKYFEMLQNKIKEMNIEDSCFIFKNTNKLQELMAESSIYAMTSITECYPMVLLEAKQVNLPIISYDCPHGPRNIILDKVDGILVNNQDKSDFKQKLITLIKNKNLRQEFGENAIKQVEENSIDLIMEKWIYLFNSKHK